MLAWKARKYLNMLREHMNEKYGKYGVNFEYIGSRDDDIGMGATDARTQNIEVKVASGNICEKSIFKRASGFKDISDLDFIKIGVAVTHEGCHVEQNLHIGDGGDDMEVDLSYLVKNHNPQLMLDCYSYDPREVEAEWYGIVDFVDWCNENMPDDFNASRLVAEYVEWRRNDMDHKYFDGLSDRKLENIDDICDAFEMAYDYALDTRLSYSSRHMNNQDLVYRMLEYGHAGYMDRWDFHIRDLENAFSFLDSAKMYASLGLVVHPEDADVFPSVQKFGIRAGQGFSRSLPETVKSVRERLSDAWDGITREYLGDMNVVEDDAGIQKGMGGPYDAKDILDVTHPVLERSAPAWKYDVKKAAEHGVCGSALEAQDGYDL